MKNILIVICLVGLFACTSDSTETKGNDTPTKESPASIGNGKNYTSFNDLDVTNKLLSEKLSNATQAQVDLRDLVRRNKDFTLQPVLTVEQTKELFPENLGNMTRKSYAGEINSMLGSPTTFVKADYRLGEMVARISFSDSGAHPGVIVKLANWADRIIDRKENGFEEHTKTFGGYPAYEKSISKRNDNTFEFVVDNRWVVSIHSLNIAMDQVHKLAGSLNIDKLRSLANNK